MPSADISYISDNPDDTERIACKIGRQLGPGSVISLRGALGSGKTVFARGIAAALGINEPITSPTFNLVNEYTGTLPLFHMDLYRIDSEEEFQLIGGEEILYGPNVTIIEWSEVIDDLLPESTILVTITIENDLRRKIHISNCKAVL